MLPTPPPVGKGDCEHLFSGDKDPVGSFVRAATARVASPSSSLAYGEGDLGRLGCFAKPLFFLSQKPLLRDPSLVLLQAGGLYPPPDIESSISESESSDRKPLW